VVIPLYDENPLKWPVPPFVTWGLIAVNLLVFLVVSANSDSDVQLILDSFGAIPSAVFHHTATGSWCPPELTLVTSMFLHNGWGHILGNMIYLWVFGDDIEEAIGPLRFLLFYFLSGIVATLAYCALHPHSTTPLVGASGAIAGVLAAYLLLRPCAKVAVLLFRVVVRIRAYWVIGGWVILQLYLSVSGADDGVAYAAHVGGLAAGAVLFLLLRPATVDLFECIEEPDPAVGGYWGGRGTPPPLGDDRPPSGEIAESPRQYL